MTAPKAADKTAKSADVAAEAPAKEEKKSDARGKTDEAIAGLTDAQLDSVLQFAESRAEHRDPAKEFADAAAKAEAEKTEKEAKVKKAKGEPEAEPTPHEAKLNKLNDELDKLTDGGLNSVTEYANSQAGR